MRKMVITALPLSVLCLVLAALPVAADYAESLEDAYPADGPGGAVIVVKDGDVVFRAARGMADMELGIPLEPGHVFRLGSITKQFTAAAIMKLADEGKLSVDDEITRFLPDYPTQGHTITIEHLLTHTSGIFSYTNIPGYMAGPEIRADLTTEELIEVFDDLPMQFAPGTRWEYSNSAYVLLGAIIEKVSGQSYAEYVREHLFKPLGMDRSHYGGHQIIPGRVQGYGEGPDGIVNAPYLSMTQPHAAGSLLSTVDDLARWNAGLFGGDVISAESLERMTTDFTLTDGEGTGYGYGLAIGTFRGEPSISHGGGIHGFATYGMWLPDSGVYVAVLSNNPGNRVSPEFLATALAAEAIGKPYPVREVIELDAETLSEYVGAYRIDEDTVREVTVADGQLFTQRSGGGRTPAFPHADDAFFYEQSRSHFVFERDDAGAVVRMLMYQQGGDEAEVAVRDTEVVSDERETAEVSPELYDLWAGDYQIGPAFVLTVRREGDRLISQATGQPPFELHPSSSTRYFVREFPAEIEFIPGDDGRASKIVLHQGGQEIPAPRAE
jgi:D-alanyl-D-alanine carboxypeptidase